MEPSPAGDDPSLSSEAGGGARSTGGAAARLSDRRPSIPIRPVRAPANPGAFLLDLKEPIP